MNAAIPRSKKNDDEKPNQAHSPHHSDRHIGRLHHAQTAAPTCQRQPGETSSFTWMNFRALRRLLWQTCSQSFGNTALDSPSPTNTCTSLNLMCGTPCWETQEPSFHFVWVPRTHRILSANFKIASSKSISC